MVPKLNWGGIGKSTKYDSPENSVIGQAPCPGHQLFKEKYALALRISSM